MIDCVNQLGKSDEQPNILTFYDCQGNPVKDLQALIDPQIQTEIPGVQSDVPPTTKMMEESTPEEPTIQVDHHENLADPVPDLEDKYSNPPVAPDEVEVKDSIQSMVKNTMAEPELENLKPDPVVQSNPGTNLDSEEEIQQPHQST